MRIQNELYQVYHDRILTMREAEEVHDLLENELKFK